MKYMMENAHLYPTLEMADNALSKYISTKGKCAVTHNALTIVDMVCEQHQALQRRKKRYLQEFNYSLKRSIGFGRKKKIAIK